jgi:DNA-binding HxlR family transcriptional regulator
MRYSEHVCITYQHAVEIIAKRWTTLILKVLLTDTPLRFSELAEKLSVVSDRVLSERLKELEQEGIVERKVYPETPVRIEYSLTEKGRDLEMVVQELENWSNRWIKVEDLVAEHG